MSDGTFSAFEIWLKSASTLSLEKELRALISESHLLDASAQDALASGGLFSLPHSIPSPLVFSISSFTKDLGAIWNSTFYTAVPFPLGLPPTGSPAAGSPRETVSLDSQN